MNSALLSITRSNGWQRFKPVLLSVGMIGLVACQSTPVQVGQPLTLLPQTLAVSGRGMVDVPKTTSRVSLGVEVQGKTSEEVQRAIAQKSSSVVKLLQSRKEVSKLETTGVSLNPRYSYKNSQQTIEGYSGTNVVRFQIAPDKIGKLLDDAIKAGATRIDGVTLVATDEAIATAQKQAIQQASKDAQSQAEAVLGALALKQENIISIQINGANAPGPLVFDPRNMAEMAQKMAPTAAMSTPVIPGEQRIEASITLQVRYQAQ